MPIALSISNVLATDVAHIPAQRHRCVLQPDDLTKGSAQRGHVRLMARDMASWASIKSKEVVGGVDVGLPYFET